MSLNQKGDPVGEKKWPSPIANPSVKMPITAIEARGRVQPITLENVMIGIESELSNGRCFHIVPAFLYLKQDVIFELIKLGYNCYQVNDPIGIKSWCIDWREL
jgi:hypothetical protein